MGRRLGTYTSYGTVCRGLLSRADRSILRRRDRDIVVHRRTGRGRENEGGVAVTILISVTLYVVTVFATLFLLPVGVTCRPIGVSFPFRIRSIRDIRVCRCSKIPTSTRGGMIITRGSVGALCSGFGNLSLGSGAARRATKTSIADFEFGLSSKADCSLVCTYCKIGGNRLGSGTNNFGCFADTSVNSC